MGQKAVEPIIISSEQQQRLGSEVFAENICLSVEWEAHHHSNLGLWLCCTSSSDGFVINHLHLVFRGRGVPALTLASQPRYLAKQAFKINWLSKLWPKMSKSSINNNQLEKLEAAKAAWLVYLGLLSLTGSFLALLGLTGPYLDLLGLIWPYWVLLSLI